jgi:5-formyltetrahydrofolate cyclo-ligase
MLKSELRKKYKALRAELSSDFVESQSLAIANQILSLDIWDKSYFHLFLSIAEQKEIDTEFILHVLAGKDKEVVISKSDFASHKMTHYLLTDNTKFIKNAYNIPEPVDGIEVPVSKIEVVFVPLLAFDINGNRVGYGKGFYDAFLSECQPGTIKIGLSFFPPEPLINDVSNDDIELNLCVTPEAIFSF